MPNSLKVEGYTKCPLCSEKIGYNKDTHDFDPPTSPYLLTKHMNERHYYLFLDNSNDSSLNPAKAFVDSLMHVMYVAALYNLKQNEQKVRELEDKINMVKMQMVSWEDIIEESPCTIPTKL